MNAREHRANELRALAETLVSKMRDEGRGALLDLADEIDSEWETDREDDDGAWAFRYFADCLAIALAESEIEAVTLPGQS